MFLLPISPSSGLANFSVSYSLKNSPNLLDGFCKKKSNLEAKAHLLANILEILPLELALLF
jgi:hypothetical protein